MTGTQICISKSLWRRNAIAIRVLIVTLATFLTSLPLFSQLPVGRILGTVNDQSGGAISGATVTVTDTQRGFLAP